MLIYTVNLLEHWYDIDCATWQSPQNHSWAHMFWTGKRPSCFRRLNSRSLLHTGGSQSAAGYVSWTRTDTAIVVQVVHVSK